jgi:1,2-diacylglycerol 3-beta-galactosyltransferase
VTMNGTECSACRVLILIGSTGGGHLRAAEALGESLNRRYGTCVTVEIVDALREYAPFPFGCLDSIYPPWIRHAVFLWRWGYRWTDRPARVTAILRLFWPWVWPKMRSLLQTQPADVFVSAHPLTNHYLVWGMRRLGKTTPILTLVTDPVSVHSFWVSPGVARCLVGGTEAAQKARECGLLADQVRVTGLPVNPRFAEALTDRREARRRLGWELNQPAVLILGGGEGMGRVYEIARAIDRNCSGLRLGVVAGRNRRLYRRLKATRWRSCPDIFGFVNHIPEMPLLMSAADLLVTKAGPGTLHEAFLAGLPLILSGAVPGQEEGNVRLAVEGGAGVWAPDPAQVASLISHWLYADREILARMGDRARSLARPDSADVVAKEVLQLTLTNL